MDNKLALLTLLLGLALIAGGLFQGEFARVIEEGIRICFECMGLGG